MSIIKSFSVGNGDMFYIDHNSDNFSIIDCCMDDSNRREITKEVATLSGSKGITRFISTHPDDDHFRGLTYLDDQLGILNFYCVENEAIKDDETEDFKRYCSLRDGTHHYYISKGCSRKWMNMYDEERGSSGINILTMLQISLVSSLSRISSSTHRYSLPCSSLSGLVARARM